MSAAEIKVFLLWNVVFNYVILLIWFSVFCFAHEPLYRLHTRWFRLTPETFNALHYLGMSVYKVGILLFNLAPLLALWLVTR